MNNNLIVNSSWKQDVMHVSLTSLSFCLATSQASLFLFFAFWIILRHSLPFLISLFLKVIHPLSSPFFLNHFKQIGQNALWATRDLLFIFMKISKLTAQWRRRCEILRAPTSGVTQIMRVHTYDFRPHHPCLTSHMLCVLFH